MIRQPICVLLAHVDHGKTSILDSIRGSSVAKTEAGGITQCISACSVSLDVIKKITGKLLDKLKINFTIPGILFIDSPGHEAFTNLRKRGGNIADIAILVIDINEGFKPQTIEVIEILKNYKTPFVIAANKIDMISGWRKNSDELLKNIDGQNDVVKTEFDRKLYSLVGQLAEHGFISERYDRVDDYTKQVAIIPTSAKSKEGIAELLMIITGLAQRFLEKKLDIDKESIGKATVLEVREEKGIGRVIDVIVYDGSISKNDSIVVGGLDKAIVTKVKSMFVSCRGKLMSVDRVEASCSVIISAPELEQVIAGTPLRVANKNLDKIKKEIEKEIEEILIETDKEGIIIKADSLGSLEALTNLLKNKVSIKRASIGDVNKKDIAESNSASNSLNRVILAFNVKEIEKSKDVKVINHNVIYQIIEDYDRWIEGERRRIEAKELEGVTLPCKIQLMTGYIFRQSNPAVIGVEILAGKLKKGVKFMKDGKVITEVKDIQLDGEGVNDVKRGEQVAVSFPDVVIGRQLKEGDILYSSINEEEFRKLKKLKKFLSADELELLKEISDIKRKENPVWGV